MMTRVPAISSAAFATLDLQDGSRHPPSRRQGHPRHDLSRRSAAWPRALPRAADLAQHLLGRAVLERSAEAARAQRAHAGAPHRRRLHRRPDRHRRGRRPVIPDRRHGAGRQWPLLHPGRPRQGAGAPPADRSARPWPLGRPAAAHHQGSRRSRAGQHLGSAGAQRADRSRARQPRSRRRGRGTALGVRLSRAAPLRQPERALAGRPVFPDRGRDRRSRPADQRRHRRRGDAGRRLSAGPADRAQHGAVDPHHHLGRRSDRAAGIRPAVSPPLAAARDRRCRPQPRQGARRAEMVRRLRAASPGLPADGARRGRGRARAGAT